MPNRFIPLRIQEIKDLTEDAYSIAFETPEEERFRYKPGQYLTLRAEIAGEEIRRAYSLSSSPDMNEPLIISVKRVEGGRMSNFLRDSLRVGDYIDAMPPMGSFVLSPDPTRSWHHLMIGAGSGITPLFSMLKGVLHHEPLSRVTLWYGNRDQDHIMFSEELQALGQQFGDRLHVLHSLSQPMEGWNGYTGRLNRERIYDLISEVFMTDQFRKQYYICGPSSMMAEAVAALEKHAVYFSDVHQEYFSAPLPTDAELDDSEAAAQAAAVQADPLKFAEGDTIHQLQDRESKIVLDGVAHSLSIQAGQTLLDAALEADLNPPFSCEAGICSSCKCKLLSGNVGMKVDAGLSEEEKNAGYILSCQALPLSENVEVEFE